MSGHTKGPWKAVHVGSSGGENPEDVYEVTTEDDHVRICEYVGTADALLIASAPELLDALRFIERGIKSGNVTCKPFIDLRDLDAESVRLQHPIDVVSAAIRKATEG